MVPARSCVVRPVEQQAALSMMGGRIVTVRLQGVVFYGSAHSIGQRLAAVAARLASGGGRGAAHIESATEHSLRLVGEDFGIKHSQVRGLWAFWERRAYWGEGGEAKYCLETPSTARYRPGAPRFAPRFECNSCCYRRCRPRWRRPTDTWSSTSAASAAWTPPAPAPSAPCAATWRTCASPPSSRASRTAGSETCCARTRCRCAGRPGRPTCRPRPRRLARWSWRHTSWSGPARARRRRARSCRCRSLRRSRKG